MSKTATAFIAILLLAGCGLAYDIQAKQAINEYPSYAQKISIGDNLSTAMPTIRAYQEITPPKYVRADEQFFIENEKPVRVVFMLSDLVHDNRKTDDEYTPYVFVEDKLVAIGWKALGGPRTLANHGGGNWSPNQYQDLGRIGRDLIELGAPRTLK